MNNIHKKIKNNSLPGPISLLGEAWKIYRRNFKILLSISFLSALGSIWNIIEPFLSKDSLFKSSPIPYIAIAIVTIMIWLWGEVATLYVIKDEKNSISVKNAFSKGLKKLKSYAWTSFLSFFIILGGSFLLGVPGFIFSIWLSSAIFVVVVEDVEGMSALLKSREYVRGYFWPILWRNLFLGIAFVAFSYLPFLVSKIISLPSYVNSIYTFVYSVISWPFSLIYGFLLYKHLKSIKGEFAFRPSSKNKAFFIICGILGVTIPTILIILFFVFSSISSDFNTSQKSPMTDYKLENPIKVNIGMMQSALELYYSDYGQYPARLENLVPKYLSSVPLVLGGKHEYYYELQENGRKYMLCGDKFQSTCVSR